MSDLPPGISRKNVLTRSLQDVMTNHGKDKPSMDWNCNAEEWLHAEAIGKRAHVMGLENGVTLSAFLVAMDVMTVHCNDTPLNLFTLLHCSDDDFHHDVIRGMGQHLDRSVGKMVDYELYCKRAVS